MDQPPEDTASGAPRKSRRERFSMRSSQYGRGYRRRRKVIVVDTTTPTAGRNLRSRREREPAQARGRPPRFALPAILMAMAIAAFYLLVWEPRQRMADDAVTAPPVSDPAADLPE